MTEENPLYPQGDIDRPRLPISDYVIAVVRAVVIFCLLGLLLVLGSGQLFDNSHDEVGLVAHLPEIGIYVLCFAAAITSFRASLKRSRRIRQPKNSGAHGQLTP